MKRRVRAVAKILLLLAAPLLAQSPTELKVRLTAPLTTKLNRLGDIVAAKIVEPATYAGGYLEGEVKELHGGPAGKGSSIQFDFHTLYFHGQATPVGAGVTMISNSRHQADVDEDGAAVEGDHTAAAQGMLSRLRAKVPLPGKEKSSSSAVSAKLTAKTNSLSFAVGSELTVLITTATK